MGGAFSVARGGRGPGGVPGACGPLSFALGREFTVILQALIRFLSLSFFVSPCCLSAHLYLLVYLQVQYELILVCMFERTDFSWLNIVRLF